MLENPVGQVITTRLIKSTPQTFEGKLRIEDCPRVQEFSANATGVIEYQLETRQTASGKKKIHYKIMGFVKILQASGEYQQFDLDQTARLHLVDREEDLPPLEEEPEDEDTIVAPKTIVVAELIEEEVLLSLPGALGSIDFDDDALKEGGSLPDSVFEFRYPDQQEPAQAKQRPFANLSEQLEQSKAKSDKK
jgi:uncharacterized metal-binding protein YceD (DUF177 family)